MSASLRVLILKPGKYDTDGYVQRFRRGFMPNSTLSYLASLTPAEFEGARCDVTIIDEYVHSDLDYKDHVRLTLDAVRALRAKRKA